MYKLDVLVSDDFAIKKISEKLVYNLDRGVSLSKWMRFIKIKLTNQVLPLTNGINLPLKTKGFKGPNDFIGYLHEHSNNVQYNTKGVGMYTSIFSGEHGIYVIKENFNQTCVGFSVRRLILSDWLNQKDEYLSPNEDNKNYENFQNDSIIYTLFNNASFQSSLRNVHCNESIWVVKNQFFWMSKEEMTNLANNGNYPELYNDARTDSDRHVHDLLFGEDGIYNQLSDEAKDVLDSASNLVRLSLGMRRNFADDTNHLNSWDAGYAQLKLLWKEYYPEQFKEFRAKYKVLEDKMRPMVYELGFLLK
jgi:hypothetical protein